RIARREPLDPHRGRSGDGARRHPVARRRRSRVLSAGDRRLTFARPCAYVVRMKHVVRERSVLYDVSAPKRPTNVTVNSDLLRHARALDINLSQTLESALVAEVMRRARERWLTENRA